MNLFVVLGGGGGKTLWRPLCLEIQKKAIIRLSTLFYPEESVPDAFSAFFSATLSHGQQLVDEDNEFYQKLLTQRCHDAFLPYVTEGKKRWREREAVYKSGALS